MIDIRPIAAWGVLIIAVAVHMPLPNVVIFSAFAVAFALFVFMRRNRLPAFIVLGFVILAILALSIPIPVADTFPPLLRLAIVAGIWFVIFAVFTKRVHTILDRYD